MTTTNPNTNAPTEAAASAADAEVKPAKPVRAKTSAMIASIADAGQKTAPAPLGHALVKLAEQNPKVVGLSADLAKYTDMHIFRDRFPDRFFQVGMAEQLLLGAAAGMAETGLIPFVSTYSVFAARRAYDFLCLDIAEPNLNVNVVGGLPGLTTGYGPSHQATEDIAIFRGMPNLTIVDPCDSIDIEQAVPQLAAAEGPSYLRLLRGNVPTVLDEYDYTFELGKAKVLRGGNDVVFISSGLMTMRALIRRESPRKAQRRRRGRAHPHHQTVRRHHRPPRAEHRPARGHPGKPHRHRWPVRNRRLRSRSRRRAQEGPARRATRQVPRRRRPAHPAPTVRARRRQHRHQGSRRTEIEPGRTARRCSGPNTPVRAGASRPPTPISARNPHRTCQCRGPPPTALAGFTPGSPKGTR